MWDWVTLLVQSQALPGGDIIWSRLGEWSTLFLITHRAPQDICYLYHWRNDPFTDLLTESQHHSIIDWGDGRIKTHFNLRRVRLHGAYRRWDESTDQCAFLQPGHWVICASSLFFFRILKLFYSSIFFYIRRAVDRKWLRQSLSTIVLHTQLISNYTFTTNSFTRCTEYRSLLTLSCICSNIVTVFVFGVDTRLTKAFSLKTTKMIVVFLRKWLNIFYTTIQDQHAA